MDMINDNDVLLKQFFRDAARQQIADDGFTHRVMQRVAVEHECQAVAARRRLWLTRLWTAFCLLVFAVLFVVFKGWDLLLVQLEVMVRTLAVQSFSVNVLMLFSVLFGLLFVGVGEVISSEIARR